MLVINGVILSEPHRDRLMAALEAEKCYHKTELPTSSAARLARDRRIRLCDELIAAALVKEAKP